MRRTIITSSQLAAARRARGGRLREGARWASALVVCAWCASASAQTGVSEDRVSLPEGPGSLEGVGENVGINTNMGSMSHSVAINVPQGFASVTPSLGLSYSSAAGESMLGVGWSMPMPSIERMTSKRLPRYQTDDYFAADGSDELVRLPGTNPPVYRARYERGFVRYTWRDVGDGSEGYWVAEYPDGTVGYFGATADGALVAEARVGHEAGTQKYHLVEKVDVYGHRERWTYQKFGNYSLPVQIGYVFQGDTPTYRVDLVYEERADAAGPAYISSADGGFNLLLTQRLARIDVLSRGARIRAYRLSYEPYASSGGFTRLTRVETIGAEGGTYPIVFDFAYSQALGGLCDGGDCTLPYMVDMGSTGVTVSDGSATLLDINGDALPDIIDTNQPGAHRFFINTPSLDGRSSFNPEPVISAVGRQDNHRLGTPTVQVLDVNGDGFTDLINAATGAVLINKGNGDWEPDTGSVTSENLATALGEDFDAGEGGLQNLRFIDFNGDKRIDLMRASRAQTTFFENRGDVEGFEVVDGTTEIGAGFAEDNLQLSDMNGDGQIDLVRVQLGSIRYRLNLGWGRWGDWIDIDGLPIEAGQIEIAELEDINGDALADLVVVSGESVTYALNNNSVSFDPPVQLTSDGVNGSIPNRGSEVTVLYADMNANGSSDVVWIQPGGQVSYLELFPVRPNLMTRITNGIGSVTEIQYGSVVAEMARDGGIEAWPYRLPSPMNVVKRLDQYDLFTNLHEVTEYSYHSGFYDGVEKQFRGFERVETRLVGDDTIEEGWTEEVYDVGAVDTYYNGLLLSSSVASAGRSLNTTENTYEDCPVAEIPDGVATPIRHICQTATDEVVKEGLGEDAWVRTREESEFDGYGNVTLSSALGVVSVGGGACAPCAGRDPDEFGAPCGAQCLGDESFTETEFVEPGDDTSGRWIISAPFRVRTSGRLGDALVTEELTYYDGPDFVGLPLGQLDQGKPTRTTVKVNTDDSRTIEQARFQYNDDGMVVEDVDPLGEPGGTTHRRVFEYDVEGLRVVRADVLLEDPEGEPYALRREIAYEPRFDKPLEATDWSRVEEGVIVSPVRGFAYTYDEFGRLTSRFLQGNTSTTPDETFSYELANPVSRIVSRKRSNPSETFDLEYVSCFDGRGRKFQSRRRIDAERYQVSGLTRFNIRSSPVEIFQPYVAGSGACDVEAPQGARAERYRHDATGRLILKTLPDADLYGTPSVTRTEYAPLVTRRYDSNDADDSSAFYETPVTTTVDGLGRTTSIARVLAADGVPALLALHYDGLGRLVGYTDAGGHRKSQEYDLLGRVVKVIDPNSAEDTRFVYDDAGNVTRKTDDRGVTTVTEYDGMNRPVAMYDEDAPEATRITFVYDAAPGCDACTYGEGQLVLATYPGLDDDARGVDQMGYDVRNRIVHTSRTLGGLEQVFAMTYDNANRLTATTYPDGRTIASMYDGADRLVGVEGVVEEIAYTDRDQLASVRLAHGVETTMTYDGLMRQTARRTEAPGQATLQGFGYAYDRADNLLAIEDLAPARPDRPAFGAVFEFDAWYRTTSSTFAPGGERAEQTEVRFDTIDNITSITSSRGAESPAHVGALSYDSYAPNAVTEAGDVLIGYDAAGNVIERGEQTYRWDFMGRMTGAFGAAQEPLARFVYGRDHNRVAKLEGDQTVLYGNPSFEVRDGISSLYVRIERDRVARLESDALATQLYDDANGDGQISAADAYLTRDDQPGAVLWSSVRRLLMETGPDDGTTYLHHDHLGSITLATGERDGEVVVLGQRAFHMLGTERDSVGYVDEYGFTGQEIDRSTGLVHFEWRYLDPRMGRWLSIDPKFATAKASDMTNLGNAVVAYGYVEGNFANLFDPNGLDPGDKTSAMAVSSPSKGKTKGKTPRRTLESRTKFEEARRARDKRKTEKRKRMIAAAKSGMTDEDRAKRLSSDRELAIKRLISDGVVREYMRREGTSKGASQTHLRGAKFRYFSKERKAANAAKAAMATTFAEIRAGTLTETSPGYVAARDFFAGAGSLSDWTSASAGLSQGLMLSR